MSFNVRGSFRDVGSPHAWRNRAALNVATIERHAPTLIGLQECQRGNLAAYRENLPWYEVLKGPRYGNAPPYDFNAVLFDPEHLEPVESGGFWLSETPWRPSRSWKTRVMRSANWTLFYVKESELSLLHLNTHLDHKSPLARREGSALVVRKIDELLRSYGTDTPAIVTGDFNCRPGTPTYENFIDAGFVDTYLAAGNSDDESANTFHAFKGTSYRDPYPKRGPRRIDWVLLKDPACRLTPLSHGILHDHANGLYPSDHYPIMAHLAQREGAPPNGTPSRPRRQRPDG